MTMREDSRLIDAAAADWASRVEGADLPPDEQAQFDAWLASDSRCLGAFARARAVIQQIKSLKGQAAGLQTGGLHGPVLGRLAAKKVDAGRRGFLLWGAGGLAAALGAGVVTRYMLDTRGQNYATRRGEIRLVPLADGSSVTLNTSSRIAVAFDGGQRVVHLLEGEALFSVVDDKARTFLVQAGDTLVSAGLGQFSVSRLVDEPVKVLVQAGAIEVRGRFDAKPPVRLGSNSGLDVTANGPQLHALSPAEVSRALVWREGMLAFEDVTLDKAVAQFARYSDLHIVLDDSALKHETVTGLFAATDPQGFVQAVAPVLNLRSRREADGLHISRS